MKRSALVILPILFASAFALAQSGEPFTPEERRALRRGELVRRPTTRTVGRHHFIGGTSWMRVRASQERTFREVLDTSAYPRLIPGVVEARLVEEHGDERVVYLRHEYAFISASYHANVRIERDTHTVRFTLDRSRPHDIRAGHGFVTVDPYGDDHSIVTWGVMADVGNALLTGVFAPLLYDWILKVPWCVRGRLEENQPGC